MDSTATQCQFCWRVRDDGALWSDLSVFMQKYNLQPHEFSLSEGYCPECNAFYCLLTQPSLYSSSEMSVLRVTETGTTQST